MKISVFFCQLIILFSPLVELSQSQKCLMKPPYLDMEIPVKGFIWLENEEFEGTCDEITETGWTKYPGKEFNLYIQAEGPEGRGRYWNVSIGFSTIPDTIPERGFCFVTSTVGWRTLRNFDQIPLKWASDEDADGKPELVIWDSFPLSEEPTMVEFGLMAWVYQVDGNGKCKIDWNLSRKKAFEIAASYQKPLEKNNPTLTKLRKTAFKALVDFASGKCNPGN